MQHSKFHDGTFVIHKIMLGKHKYSAWFGRDGIAFSAEMVLDNGNTRSVAQRSRGVWDQLNRIGRRYVKA